MKIVFLLLCFLTIFPSSIFAQEGNSDPIEITADGALEWRRSENMYVARDNAKVVQNGSSLEADYIEAHYEEGGGSTSITRILATGSNLKVEGDGIAVTAKESLEYFQAENKFVAKGNAVATQENNTIRADTLTSWFKDSDSTSGSEGNSLEKALAVGNVVITTPTEKATGNQATYDGATSIAELTGNVKIMQDSNILEGARATVNTKTGISQLFAGSESGRVKGIFYPKK